MRTYIRPKFVQAAHILMGGFSEGHLLGQLPRPLVIMLAAFGSNP